MDEQTKEDVELLINVARPQLARAYKNADANLYHKITEQFILIATRIFMHLYENSDVTGWFSVKACGPKLCNPVFWKYTNLVHSFCDYLHLRFGAREIVNT
jgi:hypothetical protein